MNPLHYRLSFFEEAAGPLHKLSVEQEILIAHIGKIFLALPTSLEQSLCPLIGQTLSILRTNLTDKPYIFIVLAEEQNHLERDKQGG